MVGGLVEVAGSAAGLLARADIGELFLGRGKSSSADRIAT
jgi:hypothetical protein